LLHTIPSPMQGYCYRGGGGYGRVGGYGSGSLRVPRYGMVWRRRGLTSAPRRVWLPRVGGCLWLPHVISPPSLPGSSSGWLPFSPACGSAKVPLSPEQGGGAGHDSVRCSPSEGRQPRPASAPPGLTVHKHAQVRVEAVTGSVFPLCTRAELGLPGELTTTVNPNVFMSLFLLLDYGDCHCGTLCHIAVSVLWRIADNYSFSVVHGSLQFLFHSILLELIWFIA
jgi:hypothetical protein